MGSRTVTSVDDIRFTMRLHEFYDQVGLSRVVSSLLSGNAGDETHLSAFHSYFLTFHLLSFLFLSFDTFDTLPSFHHIISFSFFINLWWWTLGGYKLGMKGVGVLGRFGLIERLNQVWFAADIHIFIDIYIPSIHSSTSILFDGLILLHLGRGILFGLICLLYISSSCIPGPLAWIDFCLFNVMVL